MQSEIMPGNNINNIKYIYIYISIRVNYTDTETETEAETDERHTHKNSHGKSNHWNVVNSFVQLK